MEIMFCTNCGSKVLDFDGQIYTCQSCQSKFEKKQIDSQMFVDLRLANEKRQSTHFDEAKRIYKQIIEDNPNEDLTDVYWGLFLCEQRVIFEEDGKGEHFPSFYRMNSTSIEDSPEFSKAITYALKHNKEKVEVFNNLGEKIETARKMYLDISTKTKPFDVFICFKNTDFEGNHTPDRQLALDIYNEFSGVYNIFFSEKTLKNIKSSYRDYEPNIYYGLYTAKVMLLICSKREYIESQWLKNEWSRFTQINKQGADAKCIIPIFTDNFDPNNLPEELWHNQGIFDDRKLISNLSSQLESIIHPVDAFEEFKKEQERQRELERKRQEQEKLEQEQLLNELKSNLGNGGSTLNSQIQNYIDAIKQFIELENYTKAKESLIKLTDLSPNAFEVYYYSMFITHQMSKIEDLCKVKNLIISEDFINTNQFAKTEAQKSMIKLLEQSILDYNQSLIVAVDEAFKKGVKTKFKTAYETLSNQITCFETYFYKMFYNNNVITFDALVKLEGIFEDIVLYELDNNICGKCGKCLPVCSTNAISSSTVSKHIKGKVTKVKEYALDKSKCIKCGKCFDVCSYKAIIKKTDSSQSYSKTLEICKKLASTDKQKELMESLFIAKDNYIKELAENVKKSFETSDSKSFEENVMLLQKFNPETFVTLWYTMYHNQNLKEKTFSFDTLIHIPDLTVQPIYEKLKNCQKTEEEQQIFDEFNKKYNDNIDSLLKSFTSNINDTNDISDLIKTYNNIELKHKKDRFHIEITPVIANKLDKLYTNYVSQYYSETLHFNTLFTDIFDGVKLKVPISKLENYNNNFQTKQALNIKTLAEFKNFYTQLKKLAEDPLFAKLKNYFKENDLTEIINKKDKSKEIVARISNHISELFKRQEKKDAIKYRKKCKLKNTLIFFDFILVLFALISQISVINPLYPPIPKLINVLLIISFVLSGIMLIVCICVNFLLAFIVCPITLIVTLVPLYVAISYPILLVYIYILINLCTRFRKIKLDDSKPKNLITRFVKKHLFQLLFIIGITSIILIVLRFKYLVEFQYVIKCIASYLKTSISNFL